MTPNASMVYDFTSLLHRLYCARSLLGVSERNKVGVRDYDFTGILTGRLLFYV